MTLTCPSSRYATPVSASSTARRSLSRSGRADWKDCERFAERGRGRTNCTSTFTGPFSTTLMPLAIAHSATLCSHGRSCVLSDVVTIRPLRKNERVEPFGWGRPSTLNVAPLLAGIQLPLALRVQAGASTPWAAAVATTGLIEAPALAVRVLLPTPTHAVTRRRPARHCSHLGSPGTWRTL